MDLKFNVFVDGNSTTEEIVKYQEIHVRLLKHHGLQLELQKFNVQIDIQDGNSISFRGSKAGVQKAKMLLENKIDNITHENYTLKKVAIVNVYLTEKENKQIDVIEERTRCLIYLKDEKELMRYSQQANSVTDHSTQADELGAVGRTPSAFQTKNGITILHIEGDLAKQKADVIVTSAAADLNLKSGATTRGLLKIGTKELQENCNSAYPKPIKSGKVAFVRATSSLACSSVYLAYLPDYSTLKSAARKKLFEVIKECLTMASKQNKTSIAFSALGTGALKYPVDMVARTMYDAIIEFSSQNADSSVKQVQIVLYPQGDKCGTIQYFTLEQESRLKEQSSVCGSPKQDIKFGKINVEYTVGNLADQKVDVIVCSTSGSMDLQQKGAVNALLQKGGPSLQDECKRRYNNTLKKGQVAEISGGKLACKHVFLTHLPDYKNQRTLEQLQTTIQDCLSRADNKKCHSVAMPLLGLGNLKYPTKDTCAIMYEAVKNWDATKQTTTINKVLFILYNEDPKFNEHRKAFSSELKRHFPPPSRKRDFGSRISLRGPYMCGYNSCMIHNVKLSVTEGDILEHKADSIVISVNTKPDGPQGILFKSAMEKSTEHAKFKKIIEKMSLKPVKIVSDLGLNAKHVIFVQYQTTDWSQVITKCLQQADNSNWSSVYFPVLGAGYIEPQTFASQLFNVIGSISMKYVKRVKLVVFDSRHFDPILVELHKHFSKKMDIVKKEVENIGKNARKTVNNLNLVDESVKEKLSTLEVILYAEEKNNIDYCKKELTTLLENEYITETVEDDILKDITPEEEKRLQKNSYFLDLCVDKTGGKVSITGLAKYVRIGKDHIQTELSKICREHNIDKEAPLLYEQTRWNYEEKQNSGKFTPYDMKLNYSIEHAFKEGKECFIFQTTEGADVFLDFESMKEFPIGHPLQAVVIIRRDVLKCKKDHIPEDWVSDQNGKFSPRFPLENTSDEYQRIEKHFCSDVTNGEYAGRIKNASNVRVTKIERIQNTTLHDQYIAFKEKIEEEKGLPPVVHDIWFGAKSDDIVDIIIRDGFNRSYCDKKNGPYGDGAYFEADASMTVHRCINGSTKSGQIFFVMAVTGQLVAGKKGMRYLPAIDPQNALVKYDSAVDNVQKPKVFVLFHDTQSYPAYLLSYTFKRT